MNTNQLQCKRSEYRRQLRLDTGAQAIRSECAVHNTQQTVNATHNKRQGNFHKLTRSQLIVLA